MSFKKIVEIAAMRAAANAVPDVCECQNVAVRERLIRGGSKQYVRQCLDCGESVGNPVKQSGIVEPFDDHLRASYRERCTALRESAKAQESAQWWGDYESYMSSSEWRSIRAIVLSRDKNTCQGCLSAPANEVHHKTYEHFGQEFAFELISLCKPCHERMHVE